MKNKIGEIKKALYIKLGRGGSWESECIKPNGTIRLGFREIDHSLCINGQWDKVASEWQRLGNNPSVSTGFTTQIKYFYEEPSTTVWFTFSADSLWWCTAKEEVSLLDDKTKIRHCLSDWTNKDLKGQPLLLTSISGQLLQTRGYRGTICEPAAMKYLIGKIKGEKQPEVENAILAKTSLKTALLPVIRSLTDRDFETLVDLVFRQEGWQRSGIVGGTEKTIDLSLYAPISQELAAVQIKSRTSKSEFMEYVGLFEKMGSYSKFFYIVHTGGDDLKNPDPENIDLKVIAGLELSDLVVRAGLVDWVIEKAG